MSTVYHPGGGPTDLVSDTGRGPLYMTLTGYVETIRFGVPRPLITNGVTLDWKGMTMSLTMVLSIRGPCLFGFVISYTVTKSPVTPSPIG